MNKYGDDMSKQEKIDRILVPTCHADYGLSVALSLKKLLDITKRQRAQLTDRNQWYIKTTVEQ